MCKNEYMSDDITVNKKHTSMYICKYSQLIQTTPVSELITVYFTAYLFKHFCTIVAALCYPASVLHHRGGCSFGLQGQGREQHKMAKNKMNLAVPSDLRRLLLASSNPEQRADVHAQQYIASLSLLPCSHLCLASCPSTTGRYFLFLGLRKGGDKWRKKRLLPGCGGRAILPDDCPAEPNPSLGKPLATDECGQLDGMCHPECAWWSNCYGACLYTVTQQIIDSCWSLRTLGRAGWDLKFIYTYKHLDMWKVGAILLLVPEEFITVTVLWFIMFIF